MKDSNLVAFRVILSIVIIALFALYINFIAADLKTRIDAIRVENNALIKEKKGIEEIMIDPGVIKKEITSLKKELEDTEDAGYIDYTSVEEDILDCGKSIGIRFDSLTVNEPQNSRGSERRSASNKNMSSVIIDIAFTASLEDGNKLVGILESSDRGVYEVDALFCSVSSLSDMYDWSMSLKLIYYETGYES